MLALTSLGLLLLVAAFLYLWLGKRSIEQAWQELAARSGLSYRAGGILKYPILHGSYRNRQTTLDIHTHTPGSDYKSGNFPYTRLHININNPARSRLIIQEKHRLPSFLQATTPSGDPAVDLKFSIICEPTDLVFKVFKNSGLRERILAAHSFGLEISNQSLIFESRGVEKDVDYLLGVLELTSDIANLIESSTPEIASINNSSWKP